MAIEDITREAVLKAMEEYVSLGHSAFCERYGITKARDYVIAEAGRKYGAKVITAAAHGFLPGESSLSEEDVADDDVVNGHLQQLGFKVSPLRPLPWTREELILACDLLFENDRRPARVGDPRVDELSARLQALDIHPIEDRGLNFRSPNSVQRKLVDLATRLPEHTGALTRGGKLDIEVLEEFLAAVESDGGSTKAWVLRGPRDAGTCYRYDDTFTNHRALRPGDLVVVVDDGQPVGIGWIHLVGTAPAQPGTEKLCAACGHSSLQARSDGTPGFRCRNGNCGSEVAGRAPVTEYEAVIDDTTWRPLVGVQLDFEAETGSGAISRVDLDVVETKLDLLSERLDWYLRSGRLTLAFRTVGIAGFSDRRARTDSLEREVISEVIHELLTNATEEATAEDGDLGGPTVVAVEGPWGSGKTSLLEFIHRRFPKTERSDDIGARLTVAEAHRVLKDSSVTPTPAEEKRRHTWVPVWFNPWAHQSSEQLWAGLTRAILDAVDGAMHPTTKERERYWLERNAERLDVGLIRKSLWNNSRSPVFRLAVWSVLVPLVTRLTALDKDLALFGVALYSAATFALLLPVVLLLVGTGHTWWRYRRGLAVHYLPPDLLRGPVLSGKLAQPGSDESGLMRDPLYRARSGYLYLCQHDVKKVLADAGARGLRLVVLIDDLDRCSPQTTAEVLEAINLFLSEQFLHSRFVLGLDPVVVAAQIDHTYRDLSDAKKIAHTDDPSPGWTFLRKLVQLPVALPHITDTAVDRLLMDGLGGVLEAGSSPAARTERAERAPSANVSSQSAEREDEELEMTTVPTPYALERSPQVRNLLSERLRAQPNRSVREAKRLMTVWQYQVRLLSRIAPISSPALAEERARHAVLLAEIVARWPALHRDLGRRVDGRLGLSMLAEVAEDDIVWSQTLRKLNLDAYPTTATNNLRGLLREYDMKQVCECAEQLM